MHRRPFSAPEPLVLPSRPRREGLVEMAEHLHTLRTVEPPVVVQPPPHRRVDEPRKILQALVVPGGRHPPFSDGRTDRLGRLGTDRRQKAHKILSPAILRSSWLEGIAQEVERDVFVLPAPIVVLAVHDPGLRGMKLQTTLREPITDGRPHRFRLWLVPAVDDGIVRVALEE